VIFGFSSTRVAMMADARNSWRRCTMVTLSHMRVRNRASSMAVSPPPTTTTGLSLKKKPSQVAQALTPRPIIRCSPSIPSHLADAPVETMTAVPWCSSSPTHTRNGRAEKSTRLTSAVMKRVPKRSAWRRKSCIISGPSTPSGKPG